MQIVDAEEAMARNEKTKTKSPASSFRDTVPAAVAETIAG
jgi:hypothetical protein